MANRRHFRNGAVLVLAVVGYATAAGCGTEARGASAAKAPPPTITVQQAAAVQSAYDKTNNDVNKAYDTGGIPRIEAPPMQLASVAWLKIKQQLKQPIPPITNDGGTFLVPAAGGYPRWFVSAAIRVRGGVPSARPVYTVFSQQADGAPWLAAYSVAPADTVPAVRTNPAGAATVLTDASGLVVDPATLGAAIFAHATTPTPPSGDMFARTTALDDQLTAGYRVGTQMVGARGWRFTRTINATTYPTYV